MASVSLRVYGKASSSFSPWEIQQKEPSVWQAQTRRHYYSNERNSQSWHRVIPKFRIFPPPFFLFSSGKMGKYPPREKKKTWWKTEKGIKLTERKQEIGKMTCLKTPPHVIRICTTHIEKIYVSPSYTFLRKENISVALWENPRRNWQKV